MKKPASTQSEAGDDQAEVDLPVPEYWMDDDDVERTEYAYSTRNPDDWVSPRVFTTQVAAAVWGRGFYGERYRGVVQSPNRVEFAVLVKGPRGSK